MVHSQDLQKAAYIDRDGVLNHLVDRGAEFRVGGKPVRYTAPFTRHELRPMEGVNEALKRIEQKGYLRILVTNQPDVATGNIQPEEFETMMDLFRVLPLSEICICMHHPKAGCTCRKPLPGMLLSARDKHGIDMRRSYMIGDMETDIQAGKAAGVKTILVTADLAAATAADHCVLDITQASHLLP